MEISSKSALRKEMRACLKSFLAGVTDAERKALKEDLRKKIECLPEFKNAEIIFAYIPDKLEADCAPIIQDALSDKKKVAVPKVDSELLKSGRSEMDFYFLKRGRELSAQLEIGAYGILEPKKGLKKFRMRPRFRRRRIFVIVPGLAFTQEGKRLGHGKGFYDIFIKKLKDSGHKFFLCGFCLPCQIVENLCTEEHDILMDKVIF